MTAKKDIKQFINYAICSYQMEHLIVTFMPRCFERILRNLHSPVQRRMWSNDFVIPHNSKTEVLSASVIYELVFLL